MKIKPGIYLLFAYLFQISFLASGINRPDSLNQLFHKAVHDTTRIKLLIEIADFYKKQNPDSAYHYINLAFNLLQKHTGRANDDKFRLLEVQCNKRVINLYYHDRNFYKSDSLINKNLEILDNLKGDNYFNSQINNEKSNCYYALAGFRLDQGKLDEAAEYYHKSLILKSQLNDSQGMSKIYNNIGTIYYSEGNYDRAIEQYLKSLQIREGLNDKKGISNNYINLGLVYYDQGKYDKAIESYQRALKIKEELNDEEGMANCFSNLGNLHADQKNFDFAIDYYNKALAIREKQGDKNGMAACYSNIGVMLADQKKFYQAKDYYMKSAAIYEELKYKKGIADCYNNLGIIYKNNNQEDIAIDYYLKSLEIRKKLNDVNGIAIVYSNLASLYSNLGKTRSNVENIRKAEQYALKTYDIVCRTGMLSLKSSVTHDLMEIYSALGNKTKALDFARIHIITRDSLLTEEKTRALAEMEIKYQSEKKQQEIEKTQLLLEKQNLEIQQYNIQKSRQRIIVVLFAIALIFAIIIIGLVYRNYRIKKRDNLLLVKLNAEISQQKEEIIAQSEEIEIQNKRIKSSIEYASLIQMALLPHHRTIESIFSDYFILYKPCEIVSGDFYYIKKIGKQVFIAVADCTGHGVPGAFMSMLGATLLNEIVHNKSFLKASQVLDQLRVLVKDALQQTGGRNEQHDSIDIAFCVFDTDTFEMNYAGANIPLWLLRKKQSDNVILPEVYNADFQPAGIYVRERPFTDYFIKLNSGDSIYLLTDGLKSQFGGPKGSRFKDRQIKEILLGIYHKPMSEQRDIFDQRFTEWKGNYEQIDDVLILGVRI